MVEVINDSINSNLEGIWKYLSYFSREATDLTVDVLNQFGLNPSVRWASYFTLFFSLLLIYIGMIYSKPVIKIILVVFGIILLGGLVLVPWW